MVVRCIVRYPKSTLSPGHELDRVARDPAVTMIDRAADGLALLDVENEALARVRSMLPGWVIEQEQQAKPM